MKRSMQLYLIKWQCAKNILNLLWDSSRKILDTVANLRQYTDVAGWRKIKDIRKSLKSQYRATAHQVFKCKSETQKKSTSQKNNTNAIIVHYLYLNLKKKI